MNRDSFLNLLVSVKSKTIYVILLKDDQNKLTLLADPGESKPWSSTNKRLADFHATQCDGEARTWQEAFDLLKKEYPDFERELHKRVENQRDGIIHDIVKPKPNDRRN